MTTATDRCTDQDTDLWAAVREVERLRTVFDLTDPADPLAVDAAILALRAAEIRLDQALRALRPRAGP